MSTEWIRCLPVELRLAIFYFIPLSHLRSNVTQLIQNVVDVYSMDHDPDLTKQARKYYIKNILSFSTYVFRIYEGCIFGRNAYDTLELGPAIVFELERNK